MAKQITGSDYQLGQIFSSDFDFYIPSYQRPYAWTEDEVSTLFEDLYHFFTNAGNDERYFLGSIVLIKEERNPHAEVIDGQQRLTTLTLLLSAIASQYPTGSAERADCETYLREAGKIMQGIPARPRLHLRNIDQGFFEAYIQNVKLDELLALTPNSIKNEAQAHIQKNCAVILNLIQVNFNGNLERLGRFAQFLLQRCDMVAVYTPNKESAFRIFSVMNSRGLDLLPIDIIKAEVIGKLPEGEIRDKYTEKWEGLEAMISRSGLNDVLTHTRMIFAKEKAKKNLLDEFKKDVMKENTPDEIKPDYLIDEIIEPYCEAYAIIKNRNFKATSRDLEREINKYLDWLNEYDNMDWHPATIKFLSTREDDPEYVLWFVKKLERLAGYLNATGKTITQRMTRYIKLLNEMSVRPDHNLSAPLTSIELTDDEKAECLKSLDGDIYTLPPNRRLCILQRLDNFISEGDVKHTNRPTIEHVLPQTVNADSEWARTWPDETERKEWVHRIGNLLFLTRIQNSKAQNYDFAVKKEKYFKSKKIPPYPLTVQVLDEPVWTPEVVKRRQTQLLDVFKENWNLF